MLIYVMKLVSIVAESRLLMLEMCTRHLKLHFMQKTEVRICGEILGDVLTLLHHQQTMCPATSFTPLHNDIKVVAFSLLDPLIELLSRIDRYSKANVSMRDNFIPFISAGHVVIIGSFGSVKLK